MTSWETMAPMPDARWELCNSSAAIGTKAYVVGGKNATVTVNTLLEYDTVANSWATKAPLPDGPQREVAVAVLSGKLYAAGGYNDTVYSSALRRWDPSTNAWTPLATMPQPMMAGGLVTDGTYLYYAAGENGATSAALWRYDPVANTWATLASMPVARTVVSVGLINGVIYVRGGYYSTGPQSTIYAYSLSDAAWYSAGTMPSADYAKAGAVINGVLVSAGDASTTAYCVPVSTPLPWFAGVSATEYLISPGTPAALLRPTAAAVGDYLYVFGGRVGTTPAATAYRIHLPGPTPASPISGQIWPRGNRHA